MAATQHSAFGSVLRRYRTAVGMTQEELAERARLSARAISALERGVNRSPRKDTLQLLADALQLLPDERATFEIAARRSRSLSLAGESRSRHPLPLPLREERLPTGGFLGSLPSGTLVARQEEVSRILAAVDAVVEGMGRLILLRGEPGIGKTRLAQEAMVHLHDRSFLVAAGRCYEAEQAAPFYPFLEALSRLYAVCPTAIRSEVPHRWAYLGQLLPGQGVFPPARGPDAQEERRRLFRAVTSFLQTISVAIPVAVMLDDLHWADASSVKLLVYLARETRADRVLLLGTYRDVEVNPQHALGMALRDLDREGIMEGISVRPLSEEGTAAMIAAILETERVSEELAALVHQRTEGNPFFIQQVLRALVERDAVSHREGDWTHRSGDGAGSHYVSKYVSGRVSCLLTTQTTAAKLGKREYRFESKDDISQPYS
jgi:transcriptional regulator with XRE-family HTH domain